MEPRPSQMTNPEWSPVSPEKHNEVDFLSAGDFVEALYEAGLEDDSDRFGCLRDLAEKGFSDEWLLEQRAQLRQMQESHRQIGSDREAMEALGAAATAVGRLYDEGVKDVTNEVNRLLKEQPFTVVAINEQRYARYLKSLSTEVGADDEYAFWFLAEDDDIVAVPASIAIDPQGLNEAQLQAWATYTQKYDT